MISSRDALVATVITAGILGGWYVENRPRAGHAADLRDLYASPVCVRADGSPAPGSPTVRQAWARTIRIRWSGCSRCSSASTRRSCARR